LGWEFEEALGTAFELLRQAPEAGPAVYRDVRRILLRRFPYAVYYTLTSNSIDIRAVAHMHRDPEHWQKRR
jgi:plasmid stabilization system protein ParE